MKTHAGYSVVELLIATAVMLTAAGAVFRLLDDAVGRSTFWNESADLHQRARVAVDALSYDLRAAGAGSSRGPLQRFFAAIEPRRRTVGAAATTAITLRYVPDHAPWSTLAGPLPPGDGIVSIARHDGCPQATLACGFHAGMNAVIFDSTGNWDTVLIQSTGMDAISVIDRPASRGLTYGAGAEVAQIVETTLYFDPAALVLRREHAGVSDFPLLDNVVDLRFEYFGEPSPPVSPRPPVGVANCLYDASGAPLPLPRLAADHGALASLPAAMLGDGPMCGTGATAYDVDLLRIRMVRVSIRLQTGVSTLRGADSRRFSRPGTARLAGRMLPDETLVIEISPRNIQR